MPMWCQHQAHRMGVLQHRKSSTRMAQKPPLQKPIHQGDSQCLTCPAITCRIVLIATRPLIASITAPTTTTMKETTMLSNLYRRISIWWGEQLHRRHKRRYKNRGPSDD